MTFENSPKPEPINLGAMIGGAKLDATPAENKSAGRQASGASFGFGAVLFFVGSILICWPAALSDHALHVVKWLVPILLVIAYCVCGFLFKWYKPERGGQRFIDNVYYLGFLYTQVALVAGFIMAWYAQTRSGTGLTADQLVPLIGAALGASVAGLAGKMWFDDLYEREAQDETLIRERFEVAAHALADQTEKVVGQFQRMGQALQDAAANMQHVIAQTDRTFGEARHKQTEIVANLTSLNSNIIGLQSRLNAATDAAQANITGMKDELGMAVRAIGDLSTTAASSRQMVDSTGKALETASAGFGAIKQMSDGMKSQLNGDISEFERQLADAVRRAGGTADAGAAAAIKQLEQEVENSRIQLAGLIERMIAALNKSAGSRG